MAILGERAVVLGASMAGMLAARVASEHYRMVTVVDRDELSTHALNRRGVPQGWHGHVLQAGGSAALEELFGGILDQLVAAGAPVWNDGDMSKTVIEYGGHRFLPSGQLRDAPSLYLPSRALLDSHVLQRLSELPNVTILDGYDVVGLAASDNQRRVTGVAVARRDGADAAVLGADLVVDATGRGSRTPVFLEQLGYDRPHEDELVVNLSYTSQWIRLAPGAIRENMVATFPKPGELTTVALLGHENDTWLMTVGTLAGQEPARDYADMLTIARRRLPEHIRVAVESAEPVGKTAHYRTPSSRWRRYDRMVRFPEGLVVTGDAVCSFNPIYGQGMTVAALDAVALRHCLRRGEQDLPRRFHQSSAKSIGVAWRNAVSADLALPEIAGERPLGMRINNTFADWVLAANETDPVVTAQFFRVLSMLDAPTSLMRPLILARVVRANLIRSRQVREPEHLISIDVQ
jgi:2-polyprenyl-6-methoxyphenol hydroxylase-like FAD-dependent oxidoreductase